MKKAVFTLILGLLGLGFTATAGAASFTETFLGTTDDLSYFAMAETANLSGGVGNRAIFSFDLTGTGGRASLYADNTRLTNPGLLPSTDETGYDPALFFPPYAAMLDFFFADFDSDAERLRVNLRLEAGGSERIIEEDVNLNAFGSAKFSVDLAAMGLLDEIADGKIVTVALAPAYGNVDNDFFLTQVTLTADAAPVPEPATMALLGLGLIGLAGLRRKFGKK